MENVDEDQPKSRGILTIKDKMEWDGFMRLFNIAYIKMILFSFLQLQRYSFESWPYMVSNGLAIVWIAICIFIPWKIRKLIRTEDLKGIKFTKLYGGMCKAYKKSKFTTASF